MTRMQMHLLKHLHAKIDKIATFKMVEPKVLKGSI